MGNRFGAVTYGHARPLRATAPSRIFAENSDNSSASRATCQIHLSWSFLTCVSFRSRCFIRALVSCLGPGLVLRLSFPPCFACVCARCIARALVICLGPGFPVCESLSPPSFMGSNGATLWRTPCPSCLLAGILAPCHLRLPPDSILVQACRAPHRNRAIAPSA